MKESIKRLNNWGVSQTHVTDKIFIFIKFRCKDEAIQNIINLEEVDISR